VTGPDVYNGMYHKYMKLKNYLKSKGCPAAEVNRQPDLAALRRYGIAKGVFLANDLDDDEAAMMQRKLDNDLKKIEAERQMIRKQRDDCHMGWAGSPSAAALDRR